MPRRLYIVSRSYIEWRIGMMIAKQQPERFANLSPTFIHTFATDIMERKGFPVPYWTAKEREELHHDRRWYVRERIEAYLVRVVEPHVAAGLLDIRKWQKGWK